MISPFHRFSFNNSTCIRSDGELVVVLAVLRRILGEPKNGSGEEEADVFGNVGEAVIVVLRIVVVDDILEDKNTLNSVPFR